MTILYSVGNHEFAEGIFSQYISNALPQIIETGFLKFSTQQEVLFVNADTDALQDPSNYDAIIPVDFEDLIKIEHILKVIKNFSFYHSCKLKSYNIGKELFIVDSFLSVQEGMELGEGIQSLTILSCKLNGQVLEILPYSIDTTCVSCYGGEDEWGEDDWHPVIYHHAIDSILTLDELASIVSKEQANTFVIKLIHDLYMDAIRKNLDKLAKEVSSSIIVN